MIIELIQKTYNVPIEMITIVKKLGKEPSINVTKMAIYLGMDPSKLATEIAALVNGSLKQH